MLFNMYKFKNVYIHVDTCGHFGSSVSFIVPIGSGGFQRSTRKH